MPKLSPFIWLKSESEAAARFYVSIFKNSKITRISRYGGSGAGPAKAVMSVEFTVNGMPVVALNGNDGYAAPSAAVSLAYVCKTQKELDKVWARLCKGGTVLACGWLTDKFGVTWQIHPEGFDKLLKNKNQAKVDAAMRAMMKMKKLDLKKMQKAAAAVS